jgi:hypothetical protein
MPMRPPMMGYGYGGGQVVEQDYFGPSNPGHELAQAVLSARASKRADEQAAAQEEERKAMAAWRAEQSTRQARLDPMEEAERRARMRAMGIRGPGETDGAPGADVQSGLPPAGIMAASQAHPVAGVSDPGFTPTHGLPPVGNRTQAMDSGFMGPKGVMPTGTAHDLPGAFNPQTGTHNPADIDLGGGYHMPYSATPERRQSVSADELMRSGIPNMTPALALYLSQHPEHVGPMLAQAHGTRNDPYGPESTQFHEHMREFDVAHPLRDQDAMTLAGAHQELDRIYGHGKQGGAAEVLGVDREEQLARQMMSRGFNPSRMPLSGTADRNARFQARTGRALPAAAPGEEGADVKSADRNRQIAAVTSMIPKGADPQRVREVLRSHGITDEEAEGILNPPKPRAAAGAGSRF